MARFNWLDSPPRRTPHRFFPQAERTFKMQNSKVPEQGDLSIVSAKERTRPDVSKLHSLDYVAPGDLIRAEPGFVRGHGTMINEDGDLVATVAGIVERVNRLILVRPLQSRYVAEVGDVIVGRVVDLGNKRWKVDINSRQDAVLMLSAVNLPGGVQRRRTYEDEMNMERIFQNRDMISAEIQEIRHDGGIALHTRSLKYGKLKNGLHVKVKSGLVKRSKKHFIDFNMGVSMILGNNGYVWVYETAVGSRNKQRTNQDDDDDQDHHQDHNHDERSGQFMNSSKDPGFKDSSSLQVLEKMARVRNSIIALDVHYMWIHGTSVQNVYDVSLNEGIDVKHMLLPEISTRITLTALSDADM